MLNNFNKDIWQDNLTLLLNNNGSFMQCVNHDFSGEIKNSGDIVNCNQKQDDDNNNNELKIRAGIFRLFSYI